MKDPMVQIELSATDANELLAVLDDAKGDHAERRCGVRIRHFRAANEIELSAADANDLLAVLDEAKMGGNGGVWRFRSRHRTMKTMPSLIASPPSLKPRRKGLQKGVPRHWNMKIWPTYGMPVAACGAIAPLQMCGVCAKSPHARRRSPHSAPVPISTLWRTLGH
jgi:hypothetical protein